MSDHVQAFLSMLDDDSREAYTPVLEHLTGIGCKAVHMRGQGYVLSFQHPVAKKQLVKAGVRGKAPRPFFMLRFSASGNYSEKFQRAVEKRCSSEKMGNPVCGRGCSLCPEGKHTYICGMNGRLVEKCGAYALEIPDVSKGDILEIIRLIDEQDAYFRQY